MLDWLAAGLDPERAVIYRQSAPAGGRRDGVAARDDDAARAGSSGSRRSRSGCATWPSATSRTSACSAIRCCRRSTSRSCEGRSCRWARTRWRTWSLSREIVRRFNRLYGDVLIEPQPLLSTTPLIPGSRRAQDVEVPRQHDRDPRRRGDGARDGPLVPHRSAEAAQGRSGPSRRSAPSSPCIGSSRPSRSSGSRRPAGPASSAASTARPSWPTTWSRRSRRSGSAARSSPRARVSSPRCSRRVRPRSGRWPPTRWRPCATRCISGDAVTGDAAPEAPNPPGFAVEVPGFTGPFRLLADLILEQKVDVCDVPIATVTDGFLRVREGQPPPGTSRRRPGSSRSARCSSS